MTRTPLFLALLAFSAALRAQAAPAVAPHDIPRLPEGIVIDGQLDDAAWAAAAEYELGYEIDPGDNIAAPVTTKARIGYTSDALYVSFKAMPNTMSVGGAVSGFPAGPVPIATTLRTSLGSCIAMV